MSAPLLEVKQRKKSGFARPADPPYTDIDEYSALSLRDRVNAWNVQLAREGAGLPGIVIVYYILKVLSWWAIFYYIIADRSLNLSAEKNIKRFVAYNILNDALGFGASNGPLGGRNVVPVESFYIFGRTGTMCSPLFPRIAGCFQYPAGVRGFVPVVLYYAYLASLVWALYQPMIGQQEVKITVGIVSVLTIFDTYVVFASRLEVYVYQFFCFAFGQWVFGCQLVSIALWLWAGVSKLGPWFIYVFLFMVPGNQLLRNPTVGKDGNTWLTRLMYRDFPRVLQPSALARLLMFLGFALEMAMGTLPMLPSSIVFQGVQVRLVGLSIAVLYHCFIISNMPFASVFEWNFYMIFMTVWLFKDHEFTVPAMADMSPVYVTFLAIALIIIPVIGQLAPKLVPFLMAYRPYAGNWRWCWFIIDKKAEHKLERLKTLTTPNPSKQAEQMMEGLKGQMDEKEVAMFAKAFPDFAPYVCMYFPAFRMLLSVIERLMKKHNWTESDFVPIHQEPLSTNCCGWTLGTGWFNFREVWREAFVHVCQWEEGECYMIQMEPLGLFNRTVQWRCFDATVGPQDALMHGEVPFKELENVDRPADFQLKDDQIKTGKSIRGTFLSTYY